MVTRDSINIISVCVSQEVSNDTMKEKFWKYLEGFKASTCRQYFLNKDVNGHVGNKTWIFRSWRDLGFEDINKLLLISCSLNYKVE